MADPEKKDNCRLVDRTTHARVLQLPAAMRDHLLQRLYDILTGHDADPQFAGLAATDRQAILEILRETKSNLPGYWRESAADGAKIEAAENRPEGQP